MPTIDVSGPIRKLERDAARSFDDAILKLRDPDEWVRVMDKRNAVANLTPAQALGLVVGRFNKSLEDLAKGMAQGLEMARRGF